MELYRDLTPPMTPAWREAQRRRGAPGEAQRALSRFPLRLACPDAAELLHFGTNEELIRILGAGGAHRVRGSFLTEATANSATASSDTIILAVPRWLPETKYRVSTLLPGVRVER